MGSGVLVWLPEISQAELNHIARAIYIARRDEDNDIAKAAERAFEALMARKSEAKKRLGSEDPLLLSTVLSENLKPGERSAAIAKLEGLRLLPLDKHVIRTRNGDVNGFGQMVKFWRSPQGPFGKYPSSEWGTLFEKLIPAEDEKEGKAPLKA
ncbi:MAG: hypothetical protein PHW76_02460 [Alphaproteobacteria bacterium]|nr:hypothetical protein [Alphaproteobacteria bacterium]